MSAREIAAAKLLALRTAAGQSKKGLSERTGISRDTITNVELNRNDPTVGTIEALAAAFGLEAWEMLKPGQSVHKGVPKTPRSGKVKTTEAGSDLLRRLSVTSRLGRGAKALEEAPEDDTLSPRANGSSSNSPRPKRGPKVVKAVKARTKP